MHSRVKMEMREVMPEEEPISKLHWHFSIIILSLLSIGTEEVLEETSREVEFPGEE